MKIELNIMISKDSSLGVGYNLNSLDLFLFSDLQETYKNLLKEDNLLKLLEKTRKEEERLYGVALTEIQEDAKPYLPKVIGVSEISIFGDEQKETKENYETIRSFILKNKELKNKKVIVERQLLLTDVQKIEDLFNYFSNFDNVHVTLKGESTPVDLNKLRKIIEKIDEIVIKVNKTMFSPFEKAMYAYDLVRDRVYKKSSNENNPATSRELSYVLFGEEIVCLGFANIYNCVLQKLGIKSNVCYLMPSAGAKEGHARNIMYVNDDKYDIKGIYFSDTTFDAKRKDNNFLHSYRYFCKPYSFFKNEKYDEDYGLLLDDFEDLINEYIEKGALGISASNLKLISSYITLINQLSLLVDGKRIIGFPNASITKRKFKEKINNYRKLFSNQISAEKFLKALEVVRKEEYLNNPEKYPYGYEAFFLASLNSSFKFDYLTKEEKLLLAILGEDYHSDESVSKKFQAYVDKTDCGREAEQIKLVKVLREIESKKEGKN